MSNDICERCGGAASVAVATVRSNRGGERPPLSEHWYCRECARMIGVPVPDRSETPAEIIEPGPSTWPDVENHLAHYEGVLREDPSLRNHVLSMAHQLLRHSKGIPGTMPNAVTAAFTRMGVSEISRD